MRTVEVDPERAPLIRGRSSTTPRARPPSTGLLRDLTARGLLTVPTPKRPSKPLGKNTLYKLLTNPYYAGVIRYKGALHPGAHEPIVEPALFDQVQSLLQARTREDDPARPARPPPERAAALRHLRVADAARLRHQPARHHLRLLRLLRPGREEDRPAPGGRCPSRSRNASSRTPTPRITISDADLPATSPPRSMPRSTSASPAGSRARRPHREPGTPRSRESDKLLAAHFADAIDLPTLKRHQDRIRAGLADVNRRLAEHDEHHTGGRAFLHDSLRLLTDAHHAYARLRRRRQAAREPSVLHTARHHRRRATTPTPRGTVRDDRPRSTRTAATKARKRNGNTPTSSDVACSRKTLWVEHRGFEPLTFSLRTRRATNCANAPYPVFRYLKMVHDPTPDPQKSGFTTHNAGQAIPAIRTRKAWKP